MALGSEYTFGVAADALALRLQTFCLRVPLEQLEAMLVLLLHCNIFSEHDAVELCRLDLAFGDLCNAVGFQTGGPAAVPDGSVAAAFFRCAARASYLVSCCALKKFPSSENLTFDFSSPSVVLKLHEFSLCVVVDLLTVALHQDHLAGAVILVVGRWLLVDGSFDQCRYVSFYVARTYSSGTLQQESR